MYTCPSTLAHSPTHTHINNAKDAGQNERLERLEGAVWGDVSAAASETAPSNDDDESAAAAAAVQRGDNDDSGGGGRVEEQEGDAAKPQRTKMKTLAKTVLLFGGLPLCPKVDTLQSQVRVECMSLAQVSRWAGSGGARRSVRSQLRLPPKPKGGGGGGYLALLQQ